MSVKNFVTIHPRRTAVSSVIYEDKLQVCGQIGGIHSIANLNHGTIIHDSAWYLQEITTWQASNVRSAGLQSQVQLQQSTSIDQVLPKGHQLLCTWASTVEKSTLTQYCCRWTMIWVLSNAGVYNPAHSVLVKVVVNGYVQNLLPAWITNLWSVVTSVVKKCLSGYEQHVSQYQSWHLRTGMSYSYMLINIQWLIMSETLNDLN